MKEKFKFIDLFCGIGGFHLALEQLGGKCVFACDIDEKCQEVYENNFGLKPHGDITKLNEKLIPEHDVLCAGFPCQPFSKAGFRKGLEDTRGTLFFDIARIIKYHKPSYLILENVRNLVAHDKGRTWKVISDNLKELGYEFAKEPIIFSPHMLGVPQFRQRVIILAQRRDLPENKLIYCIETPRKKCTIDSVLLNEQEVVNMEKYKLSNEDIKILTIWDEFIKGIKGNLPGFPIWANEFGKDYDYLGLPKWKQNFIIKNRNLYNDNKGFIDQWLSKHCYLKELAPSRRKFEWQAQNSERDIWKLIIQMRPSGVRVKKPTYFPALVAITQTSIIGKQKRVLTPRETARLQSFPDYYKIHEDDKVAYKQFGNSVNVKVIKHLASKLIDNSKIKRYVSSEEDEDNGVIV